MPISNKVRKAPRDRDSVKSMTNDLLHAILQAPVDLLWNGGIGTYVRAGSETDAEVGTRPTTRSASPGPSCAAGGG